MGQTNSKPSSASGSSDVESAAFTPETALERMTKMLEQVERLRRQQALLSLLGVLAILLVLVIFIVRLVGFAQNFDQAALSEAMVQRAALLVKSTEIRDLQDDFRKTFVPAYQNALMKQVQTRAPEIQKKMDMESEKLLNYAQNDLRDRVMKRLQISLGNMEKQLIAKYAKQVPSEAELTKAVTDFEATFLSDLTDTMNANLTRAKKELASLYDVCQSFKDLPEFQKIKGMPQDEVESAIVETFLELWIYHLNPRRSMMKADLNGGF